MLPTGDMRWITLSLDGSEYTSKRGLCNSCGLVRSCGHQEQGRVRCKMFVPVLKFRSMRGTSGIFNTFRHGKAWMNRVIPGSRVALLDVKRGDIKFAIVQSLHEGEKERMESAHGAGNHLMKGFDCGSHDELVESFRKKRRQNSGNMIYNNNRFATVIYMKSEE